MALTAPYNQQNYMGEFASSSACLTAIQARRWDSNGDGTGDPQDGMIFFNTTSGKFEYFSTVNDISGEWIEFATGSSGFTGVQIYYVGKHGDDTNNGKSPDSALATIGSAITKAAADSPTSSSRAFINVIDGGTYSEDINISQYITLYAPGAVIDGRVTISGVDVYVDVNKIYNNNDYGIYITSASSSIWIRHLEVLNSYGGYLDTSGYSIIDIEWLECSSSSGFLYFLDGELELNINEAYLGGYLIQAQGNDNKYARVNVNHIDSVASYGIISAGGSPTEARYVLRAGEIENITCLAYNTSTNSEIELEVNSIYSNLTTAKLIWAGGGKIYGHIGTVNHKGTFIEGQGGTVNISAGQIFYNYTSGYLVHYAATTDITLNCDYAEFYHYGIQCTSSGATFNGHIKTLKCVATSATRYPIYFTNGTGKIFIDDLDCANYAKPWHVAVSGVVYGEIKNILNYSSSYAPTSNSTTYIKAYLGNSAITTTSSTNDAIDATGLETIYVDTTNNDVAVGGFVNGIKNQVIRVVKEISSYSLVIEHNEGTGNQDILVEGSVDKTITDYGVVTLVCNGTSWFCS